MIDQTTDLTMVKDPTTAEIMLECFDQLAECHENLHRLP